MKARAKRRKETGAAKRRARLGSAPRTSVTVTFRHVEPTLALQEYAERKLAHMARFVKRDCHAHVILAVDKYRQRGEVTVKSGRLTVTAQEETKDLYSVIDLLSANVERQLKKHREKMEARKVRALSTGEVLSATEEGLEEHRQNRS